MRWEDYQSEVERFFHSFDEFLWALVYILIKYRGEVNLSLPKAFDSIYRTGQLHPGKSTVDFINFVTGVRCTIFRHFNVEFLVAGNLVTNTNEKITGTITTKTYSGGPIAYPISENVEYVNIKLVKLV